MSANSVARVFALANDVVFLARKLAHPLVKLSVLESFRDWRMDEGPSPLQEHDGDPLAEEYILWIQRQAHEPDGLSGLDEPPKLNRQLVEGSLQLDELLSSEISAVPAGCLRLLIKWWQSRTAALLGELARGDTCRPHIHYERFGRAISLTERARDVFISRQDHAVAVAVYRMEAARRHKAAHSEPAVDANEQATSSATRIQVCDADQENRLTWLDVTGTEHWGPVKTHEKWNGFEDWAVEWDAEDLYRYPSGKWVLVSEYCHWEMPTPATPTARRISTEHAADWLGVNGFDPPADIAHLVEDWKFDPAFEPAEVRRAEEADHPIWSRDIGRVTFRGCVVREVAPTAKNVRKLLDTFEECGWPERVDSPFTDDESGKGAMRETIRQLKKGLGGGLNFEADGSGTGVKWTVSAAAQGTPDIEFPF